MAIKIARYAGLNEETGRPIIEGFDVSYEGCVLGLRERNGYSDSDFDAIVWDAAEGRVKSVEYASTRGYTYDHSAQIDATPETYAAVLNMLIESRKGWSAERAWKAALELQIGKRVRVARGRKVTPGTEGRVFWMRDGRAGIELDDRSRVFVDAKHLDVIDPMDWFDFDLSEADAADLRIAESTFRNSYGSDALNAARTARVG